MKETTSKQIVRAKKKRTKVKLMEAVIRDHSMPETVPNGMML
jgi:hypothetical protein